MHLCHHSRNQSKRHGAPRNQRHRQRRKQERDQQNRAQDYREAEQHNFIHVEECEYTAHFGDAAHIPAPGNDEYRDNNAQRCPRSSHKYKSIQKALADNGKLPVEGIVMHGILVHIMDEILAESADHDAVHHISAVNAKEPENMDAEYQKQGAGQSASIGR